MDAGRRLSKIRCSFQSINFAVPVKDLFPRVYTSPFLFGSVFCSNKIAELLRVTKFDLEESNPNLFNVLTQNLPWCFKEDLLGYPCVFYHSAVHSTPLHRYFEFASVNDRKCGI